MNVYMKICILPDLTEEMKTDFCRIYLCVLPLLIKLSAYVIAGQEVDLEINTGDIGGQGNQGGNINTNIVFDGIGAILSGSMRQRRDRESLGGSDASLLQDWRTLSSTTSSQIEEPTDDYIPVVRPAWSNYWMIMPQ